MEKDQKVQLKAETAVGLFVLAALGVLIYMSFQIGAIRFATHQYAQYYLYSHDISGLNKKADVRIAGVKVGWIEKITFQQEEQRVCLSFMISRKHHLYANASGAIRQNGILGGKYLEIIPGDAHLEQLPVDSTLPEPVEDSLSMDILMKKMGEIAGDVQEITGVLKQTFGGDEGVQTMRQLMDGCVQATERFASCAESIDRLIVSNEDSVSGALADVQAIAQQVRDGLPELHQKMSKVSDAIDRDFNRVATQVEQLTPSLNKVLESYVKHHGFVIKHKFRLF